MIAQRFSGLDLLRGIAALIVALNHALLLGGMLSFVDRSYLAVDFFFLLSGFVIAAAFEERMPTVGTVRFLGARAVRLWPLIAVGVVLSAIADWVSGADLRLTGMSLMLAFLFLPGPGGAFLINNPMWSVHFELLANAAHTLALRHLSVRGLAILSAACFAMLLAMQGWRDLDVGQGDRYWLGIPRILMSYSLGILLWRINGARPWGSARIAFVLLPVAILIASQSGWGDHIVALLVNPAVLLCGLAFREDSTMRPFARFLGAWSFPLYALHWPIQKFALELGHGWFGAWLWSLAASLLIALVLDRRMRAAVRMPGLVGLERRRTT